MSHRNPPPETSERKRCVGTSKDGTRCKRNAQPHDVYCAFHFAPEPDEISGKKKVKKSTRKLPNPDKKVKSPPLTLSDLILRLGEALCKTSTGDINSYQAKGVADIAKQLIEAHRLSYEIAQASPDKDAVNIGDINSMSVVELDKLVKDMEGGKGATA